MIEVDETTESILQNVEDRIRKGISEGLQELYDENNQTIQLAVSQVNKDIQLVQQLVNNESVKVSRTLEDLLDDMDLEFSDLTKLQKSQMIELEKIIATLPEQTYHQLIDHLKKLEANNKQLLDKVSSLTQLPNLFERKTNTIIETTEAYTDRLETHLTERLNRSIEEQAEQFAQLGKSFEMNAAAIEQKYISQTEQLQSSMQSMQTAILNRLAEAEQNIVENKQLKKQMKEMSDKLIELEKEITWANTPFYKKWFTKKEET